MKIEKLETEEELNSIKSGDVLICEWHRDIRDNDGKNKRRLSHHTVYSIVPYYGCEVILDVPNNIYFNKSMFLKGESNLKSVCRACV